MSNNSSRRPLSIQSALDKSKLSSDETYQLLVEIYVRNRFTGVLEATYRLASVPNNVTEPPAPATPVDEVEGAFMFNGVAYVPAAFDVGINERSGEIPDVTLTMNDISGVVRAAMDQYQGAVGSEVRMLIVSTATIAAAGTKAQRAEVNELFIITNASVSDRTISLTLGAPNLLATNFPRRRQTSNFCQWGYKTLECGYTGALPTCDRSLEGANGCIAHENALNFGGFPGLVSRGSVR